MHSMLGHLAELATGELRADALVMGIGAIGVEQGLMNDSVPEILTDRALRRMARSVIVIADASKFEQVEPGYVFGLEEVDVLVTDDALPHETLEAVRRPACGSCSRPQDRVRRTARQCRTARPHKTKCPRRLRLMVEGSGPARRSAQGSAVACRMRAGPTRTIRAGSSGITAKG